MQDMTNAPKMYRQEGRAGMYQVLLPYSCITDRMSKHIGMGWGESWAWFKNNYTVGLFVDDRMREAARKVLAISGEDLPQDWQRAWHEADVALTAEARKLVGAKMSELSDEELRRTYDVLLDLDLRMWSLSIFIDTFDTGVDAEEIAKIAAIHSLTPEETHILLTPSAPTFVTAWELAIEEVVDRSFREDPRFDGMNLKVLVFTHEESLGYLEHLFGEGSHAIANCEAIRFRPNGQGADTVLKKDQLATLAL